jgi:hypothetical protein
VDSPGTPEYDEDEGAGLRCGLLFVFAACATLLVSEIVSRIPLLRFALFGVRGQGTSKKE